MGWAGARWEVLVEGSVLTYPLLRPQFNLSNPKYSSDLSIARKDARSLSVRGRWLLKLKDGRPSPITQLRFYTLFERIDILFYFPMPTSPNHEPHLHLTPILLSRSLVCIPFPGLLPVSQHGISPCRSSAVVRTATNYVDPFSNGWCFLRLLCSVTL